RLPSGRVGKIAEVKTGLAGKAVRDHNLGTIRPGRSFTQEELDHFARRCGFSAGQMPDPKTAIRARECRRCCRLLSSYFSYRSAAAPAEPCRSRSQSRKLWREPAEPHRIGRKNASLPRSAMQLGQRI